MSQLKEFQERKLNEFDKHITSGGKFGNNKYLKIGALEMRQFLTSSLFGQLKVIEEIMPNKKEEMMYPEDYPPDYQDGFAVGFNECLSEIKSLLKGN